MTFDEFFDQLPSKEYKELSNLDLSKVYDLTKESVIIFKSDDNTLTKSEKINQYKTFCRQIVNQHFTHLNHEDSIELDKHVGLFSTHFMLQHLLDE